MPGAGRAEDARGTIPSLVPTGEDQLKQIDDVVGVQVGQEHGAQLRPGEVGARQAGAITVEKVEHVEAGQPYAAGTALRCRRARVMPLAALTAR